MHVGIATPEWGGGKRSWHSRCMRNPQFCESKWYDKPLPCCHRVIKYNFARNKQGSSHYFHLHVRALCTYGSARMSRPNNTGNIWIWIYSIPSDKENRIKIPRILSVNALLSPSLRNVWGFLSGPRVLLHCSNERLEYYAACGKPLWCHNGFCDIINAQSPQNKRAHP